MSIRCEVKILRKTTNICTSGVVVDIFHPLKDVLLRPINRTKVEKLCTDLKETQDGEE